MAKSGFKVKFNSRAQVLIPCHLEAVKKERVGDKQDLSFLCAWETSFTQSFIHPFVPSIGILLYAVCESSLGCKEIKPVNPKGNQSWIFTGRTDAEAETPILWPPDVKSWHWKRPWCWERLKAGGEGDDRGWDGWMASPTQWTWVWVDSQSLQWTGKPGVLQSMGSQRVRHDWATELNWRQTIQ